MALMRLAGSRTFFPYGLVHTTFIACTKLRSGCMVSPSGVGYRSPPYWATAGLGSPFQSRHGPHSNVLVSRAGLVGLVGLVRSVALRRFRSGVLIGLEVA